MVNKALCLFILIFFEINSYGQWYQQYYHQYGGDLADVHFIDKDHGWAVYKGYEGGLLRTENGGATWDVISGMTSFISDCIWFIDENNGWAGGMYTKALKSTNGGVNWEFTDLAVMRPQNIQFVDDLNGWYSGFDLMRTIDGGANWTSLRPGGFDFFFYDPFTGYMPIPAAAGPPKIFKTFDGGNNWFNVLSDSLPCQPIKVYHPEIRTGWLIGSGWNNSGGFILKTTDSWKEFSVQIAESDYGFNDLYFLDVMKGWVVGDSGIILHTDDGGLNWEIQESGTGLELSSIYFVDNENGWIVGDESIILHTDNAGIEIIENKCEVLEINIFPNPVNELATVAFKLTGLTRVNLSIITQTGSEIKILFEKTYNIGINKVILNLKDLPNGIYFLKLQKGQDIIVEKFIKQ